MSDRPAGSQLDHTGVLLISSSATIPPVALEERPAAPSAALTCSERLPRDVLLRLAALSRQVGDIRQDHAAHPELSLRLDRVMTSVDALIQTIYDETAWHLAGRRG